MFAEFSVDVERLALTIDQVNKYKPPENPAKLTDSRAPDYIRKFGDSSWELDALEPNVLRNLVVDAVQPLIDEDQLKKVLGRETRQRNSLLRFVQDYIEIEG
jgi:hypothetical protein